MALQTLWGLAMEVELNLDELLLAKSEAGLTALHLAAQKTILNYYRNCGSGQKNGS